MKWISETEALNNDTLSKLKDHMKKLYEEGSEEIK